MLAIHHLFGDPVNGTTFEQDELRTQDLIVVRSQHLGGCHDDGVERAVTTGGTSHAVVRFFLEGSHRVRVEGQEVEVSGGAVGSRELRGCTSRSTSRRSDVIAVVWRKGSAMGDAVARDGHVDLSAQGRATVRALADAMRAKDDGRATRALRETLGALAASGVPVRPDAPFAIPTLAETEVANAIERTFFPLTARPMAVDLARALGVCERQALRRVNAFIAKYYASGSTWRAYVHAMRIGLSAFFMSHPRARTEHVSQLLGFSSPTSFCHALNAAGLPSPTAWRMAS